MTYTNNLELYSREKTINSNNHQSMQKAYQVSYNHITNRRGDENFKTPCNSFVNDFVPFYFSPATAMAYAIHCGAVPLTDPEGEECGKANINDIAYIVSDPASIADQGLNFWFTDIACNSGIPPNYENELSKLETHIAWSLFDDQPRMAKIVEIGYDGVCKYFTDNEKRPEWGNRKKERMAEFLVKDTFPLNLARCIILKNYDKKELVENWLSESSLNIPVLIKPECYF